ncbi:MAG: M6 family metalloprotease domain-containing protein [Nitrospirae bacterium]|nr:M6 family metalloprotease domain-containing protein [Nitrospirota bacterium]
MILNPRTPIAALLIGCLGCGGGDESQTRQYAAPSDPASCPSVAAEKKVLARSRLAPYPRPISCAFRPRPSLLDPLTGRFLHTGRAVPQLGMPNVSRRDFTLPERPEPRQIVTPRPAIRDVRPPGEIRVLILLVDFNDNPHDSGIPVSKIEDTFVGSISTGSMREYYEEVSYGKLKLSGQAFGWRFITTSSSSKCGSTPIYSCYVNESCGEGSGLCPSEPNSLTLARDAVKEFDSTVNFSQFDGNGDGFVDALMVVHPGLGGEESSLKRDLWSSMTMLSNSPVVDGVRVRDFIVVPERSCTGPARDPCSQKGSVNIGVIAHEFGHILQLPDLYDTGRGSSDGVGIYSIMGTGAYGPDNESPFKPTHFLAWEKALLGWLTPRTLAKDDCDARLMPVETNEDAIRIDANGPDDSQYFLLENRQPVGFDSRMSGKGLLITHIDEKVCEAGFDDNTVNADPKHKCVDVEEAHGGTQQLDADEREHNQGTAEDFFPGPKGTKTEFKRDSDPSSAPYIDGLRKDSGANVALTNIRLDGSDVRLCASGAAAGCPAASETDISTAPETAIGKGTESTNSTGAGSGASTPVSKPASEPAWGCTAYSFSSSGTGGLFDLLAPLAAWLFLRRRRSG